MFVQKINETCLDVFLTHHKKLGFVWLDSAAQGRFSILAYDVIEEQSFTESDSSKDFIAFLKQTEVKSKHLNLPFWGGWIGYMAFEAFAFSESIPWPPRKYPPYPLVKFCRYESFFIFDHFKNDFYFCSNETKPEKILKDFLSEKNLEEEKFSVDLNSLKCDTTKKDYEKSFCKIKKSLVRGDYFELNLSVNHKIPFQGSPAALYQRLRALSPAPMMAYLHFPELTILSASPESFFKIQNNIIVTEPIKGTIKKSTDKTADQKLKNELKNSVKDQAELLMVTDMLRNDLGRICKPGTVKTQVLFKLKTFSHYHHLVSVIFGELNPNAGRQDIFNALFPGGSITGAPKIKVIEQIQELENRARGIYTGAIGYLSHDGSAHFNIAIRTLTLQNQVLEFATGSGIVFDSDCDKEFAECELKVKGILEALSKRG